jgi:hypothetical protein
MVVFVIDTSYTFGLFSAHRCQPVAINEPTLGARMHLFFMVVFLEVTG